ncbi:hypothetical protein FGIG_01607 [Fasciola gigantica]|uniref:RUN domain-containing protein n=1 Tax=Fasciola gigantica TaxID=46835 RepID=A0A504YV46_FASGI|nr:hypothetical protein FGIG_01607 [Fasciola gigantica]
MLQTPSQFGVIKQCILDAHQKKIKTLDDQMQLVRNLCEAIESLFRLGLMDKNRTRDYHFWMEGLLNKLKQEKSFIHPDFAQAIKSVRNNHSLCSPQGKGRQMIRFLLQRGRLDFLIQQMQNHAQFAEKFYHPSQSVLAHEILVQIFGSLISEVGRLAFRLDLDNSEFLDDTWEMPLFRKYELVPCVPILSHFLFSDSGSTSPTRSFFLDNPWCQLLYLGQCEVGPDGGVHLINQSIMHVLMRQSSVNPPTPVCMELGELGVTVWPMKAEHDRAVCGSKPLFRHSFPQISSCGRRTDNTNYLAYIVGDEACTVAKNFHCFVFEAVDHAESKYLISGIAQGFDRTHWTL